ncbi:hypothetical protein NCPPB3778_54 [Rathayibacter phage NCPPB3778]|nr:hypothetical protein NCPPB3778_54 [Rathayibacter phage NCPPB3778]
MTTISCPDLTTAARMGRIWEQESHENISHIYHHGCDWVVETETREETS